MACLQSQNKAVTKTNTWKQHNTNTCKHNSDLEKHTHTHTQKPTDAGTPLHKCTHTCTHPQGICISEAYASTFLPVGLNTVLYLNKQLQSGL